MQRLSYSGDFYFDGYYRFTEPGEYEVDDTKAQQLLADFPDQFKAMEGGQDPVDGQSPTKSLSKMNRAELEAVAGEVGVETSANQTNAELTEAIKAKQATA
jgi:hypothetical protein